MKKHNKNNSSKIFFHSSAKVCTVTYFNKSFSHAKKSPFSGRFFLLIDTFTVSACKARQAPCFAPSKANRGAIFCSALLSP